MLSVLRSLAVATEADDCTTTASTGRHVASVAQHRRGAAFSRACWRLPRYRPVRTRTPGGVGGPGRAWQEINRFTVGWTAYFSFGDTERAEVPVARLWAQYLEQRLKLRVNRQKSAVAPAVDRQ
jgi:hypothetical protein